MTGYDRDQFGSGWVDVNRNGCDTRNDILRRDLTQRRVRPVHTRLRDHGRHPRTTRTPERSIRFVRGRRVGG